MAWFKVDDGFRDHRKVRKLGKDKVAAVGVWTLCGSWSADNTTDGFVPWEVVDQYDTRRRNAHALVRVGLWSETEHDGETGVLFHAWAEYQPTRAEKDAEREAWRQKKAAQRKKDRMSPGDTSGDNQGDSPKDSPKDSPGESSMDSQQESPEIPGSRPVPSRPSSGYVGGRVPEPNASAKNRPPERCPKHEKHPADGPCRACGDARRAAETWDEQQKTRRANIAEAIAEAVADPRQRCDHGTDGGQFIHPDTGRSATCAFCRHEHQEAS